MGAVRDSFPSARYVREKSELTLPFEQSGHAYTLRITLPPRFPAERPTLHVLGAERFPHEWVNERNEVISHPWLLHWRPENSLVNLCREILSRFQIDPREQSTGTLATPPPPAYTSLAQQAPDEQASESRRLPMPMEIPSSFPELEGMQLEQLERLQKDDIAFKTFFEGIEAVQTTRRLQEQLLEQNADIANENLTHQEELEALHAEVRALRSTLQDTVDRFDARAQKHVSAEATTDASVISQVRATASVPPPRAHKWAARVTSRFQRPRGERRKRRRRSHRSSWTVSWGSHHS